MTGSDTAVPGVRPLVALSGVQIVAGGRTLLSDVTLSVGPGEALRLAGPNGGGKTTLLRLLAGEVAPVRGERVYGLEGGQQRSAVRARRQLSVVGPDAEGFYLTREWAQTVRDVLLAGAHGEVLNLWTPDGAALARVGEVAALVGLEALLDRDVRTLSHGQRRRAMLGRALMAAPELMLLDEFTDGLSERARADLGELIAALHARGTAVVLATHRPEEAPPLPWRTRWVDGGQVTDVPALSPAPSPALAPLPVPRRDARPLAVLDRATVYRNGHRALGPVTWTWAPGQHWLVTGENGSGKSTLARLIAGELHPALGGNITRPFLARDRLAERRQAVGLVSAETGIRQRRDWTGRDVIGSAFAGTEGFAPPLTTIQAAQVDALTGALHVTDLLDRSAEALSQGQLRRLLLARAVVHRPTLLLLDEGLDFLDAATRARFLGLLPELTAGGTHLLVVAHRPKDAPPGLTHHLGLEAGQIAFCRPL
ncbi:ATP-binding cassette domain-containing protein [Deinococcus ficus]|uniref:ATP-binding cassette domain-containing protein n=1 Tax=Deinococcus ficus TaxID=317577 RepID=UPI0003B6B3C0|nr:ATP-binding cassette domain-containing protein [Deinococcus ficus]